MSYIKCDVVNSILYDDLLSGFIEFGFNLKKDLKNNDLSLKEFEMLLKDFEFDINNGKLGDKLISDGISSIYKIRFKDKKHNVGSSGGYRFIYILVVGGINLAIPFHLYSIERHFI